MAADYVIVSGDTDPLFSDSLEYSNGQPVNLEGATVTFIMRSLTANEPVRLTGTVGYTNRAEGKLYYQPAALDTATVGNYLASWRVVFAEGETQTFPTEGWLTLEVQPNLTGEGAIGIVGLPEVLDRLEIQTSNRTHDQKLQEWIASLPPLIEDQVGPVLVRTYDEWYEGGHSTISLRHKPSYGYGVQPVLQLMAVSEYRGPIEYNLSVVGTPTAGSVYSVMANPELGTIVRRTSGGGTTQFWSDPEHPEQSIHVIYAAGLKAVPEHIKMAAIEALKWWWLASQPQGKGAMTQFQDEPSRPMVALPYHVEALLAPNRRPPVCA